MRVVVTGAGGFIGRYLTRALLERGRLAGPDGSPAALSELVLVDRTAVHPPAGAPVSVTPLAGDLRHDAFLAEVMGNGLDSLFHLAATLTIEAERDLETGWAINLQLPLRLLEACRRFATTPRFVYASSIAVFGGKLPARVSDDHVQTPQTSYGTAKSVTELLINDYTRQGHVDGRALRLPIVVIRPGEPSGAVSDIIAGLAREPLKGCAVVSPLDASARFPVVSAARVAENLLRVHDAPASAFAGSRAVNQPGLTVSVADIVAALGRLAGAEAAARVRIEPRADIQRVVAGWPTEFVTEARLQPPLEPDSDYDSILRAYLEDYGPDAMDQMNPHDAAPAPAIAADVCIIGAGVSGLTAAKALKDAGVPFECLEKGSGLGGMWRYENDSGTSSAYRSLHIDSSRQSISFPDFPVPSDLPDYLSHRQVLQHLESYAEHFRLHPCIRFGTTVVSVTPAPDGGWDVTTECGVVRRYANVIVANGHLWDPKWPEFPGTFTGAQTHSHHYRVADPYDDKTVLVVGIGNSAVDIAVDLARRARRVLLSTRRSAWIMPKYIMGVPTDRWLGVMIRRLKMPVAMARGLLRHVARLAIGNQERFGVPRPAHPVWREHATLSQELLPYIGHGWITVKPNIARFEGDEIAFVDGTREAVDAIIYATGYRPSFPFLDRAIFHVEDGTPPALYRRIVAVDHPNLFFAGLVQPIGPTITLVEVQARWMAGVLAGRIALPDRDRMMREVERHRARVAARYVNAARYTLEVDFRDYVRDLTRDMQRQPAGACREQA